MFVPKNKIHLITYADSLGGNLAVLEKILNKYFRKAIKGVHILPFYPSSLPRGFSPINQAEVRPEFGDWSDIEVLGGSFSLTFDLITNHISIQSDQFRDYLQKGSSSEYEDWFISAEKFSRRIKNKKSRKLLAGKGLPFAEKIMNFLRRSDFFLHEKGVSKFSLKKLYLPRAGGPFVEFSFGDGCSKNIWCTFSENQVDLDINNEQVKEMFISLIELFASRGAKFLRLGGIGYVAKERGRGNFMLGETLDFISWIGGIAHKKGLLVVPEIHHRHETQALLASAPGVDFVYDFSLPMLLLRAIYSGDCSCLKKWIKIRPQNQINVLDTQDGIGVVDVSGLMSQGEIENTVNQVREYGGIATMRATDEDGEKEKIYQLNTTYFSALGLSEEKYLLARAVQFFVPGIPHVFYVGLLAGENDEKRMKEMGVGKEIMRHNYTVEEIERNCSRRVVRELLRLMELRNSHPAFEGNFSMKNSSSEKIILRWENESDFCELKADFSSCFAGLEYSNPQTKGTEFYKIV